MIAGIDVFGIITILGVIFVSMTIHEVMHGMVALWLGDDTAKLQGRLTLNPLKHVDPFLTIILPVLLFATGGPIFGGAKPVPFNPNRVKYDEWGAALVAIAGPLTNLLIAFVLFGLNTILFAWDISNPVLGTIINYGVIVNLGFFVFNIIPIPPLDGSRVLYALAPDFVRRGMEAIENFGILLVFIIVIFANGLIGSFMVNAIYYMLSVFTAIFS